jgi:putative transposase
MSKNRADLRLATRAERTETLEGQLRAKTREWIEQIIREEFEAAMGIGWYERGGGRRGYRKSTRVRSVTSRNGGHQIAMPRGRYIEPGPDGKKEWNSRILPPYRRRTEEVEDALVMTYLSGTNTRRIKHALAPLLEGAALSKSTVSRMVARLSEGFTAWRKRDLSEEDIAILYLDGFRLKVRLGRKVESIPVLCVIGVQTDGQRLLLSLEMRTSESEAAWLAVTEDLSQRGVKAPILALIDGSAGLHAAVQESWPWIDIQRCTKHKLENLNTHAPKRHYDEIKEDYHAIVYAQDESEARRAYQRFEKKWKKDCPGVVTSLQEGGDELLTFFSYPEGMRKMLRTTNAIERLNEEFRRRVKTQGSLPNADAGLRLLYGLFVSGLITLRRIDAWKELAIVVHAKRMEHGLIKQLDQAA